LPYYVFEKLELEAPKLRILIRASNKMLFMKKVDKSLNCLNLTDY